MKNINIGLCAIIVLVANFGAVVLANPVADQMLGGQKCSWGPSYWCSDLKTAKSCKAVNHCIQTVWERHNVPVDNDSICKICKDMVTQARDQLRSNETMEELKEVFEGSCNLIPVKVVKKECSKLADDFIPELVEALSSQMNPDQVCSVAGLCNNAEIDKLLQQTYASALDGTLQDDSEEEETTAAAAPRQRKVLTCNSCYSISNLITKKFQTANRDDVLENFLHMCGEMSSFSDACSSIVLVYFNEIFDQLRNNFASDGICHLSGACVQRYHQHPEDKPELDQIEDLSTAGDDIPCELCEQLIHHLRDVLIANTTETEFKQVLVGLCSQTKGFKDECLGIVDQYYDVIYKALVSNLDANGACYLIGVCPKTSGVLSKTSELEIRPLLPAIPPAEIKVTIRKKLGANEPKFTQQELQSMALPIDRLMGATNPLDLVDGGEKCALCEYVLHFIQEALATPSTEDEIKHTVEGICKHIPNSLRGECHNFIDMYGDAVIALLIQELNPRDCCPKMKMCSSHKENFEDIEVFDVPKKTPAKVTDETDKPTCPLCLFAVEQAQEKIKNDKSKQNIKHVLDNLCTHLPKKLQAECVDFVETYSNELIDMLITDFKPQEICVTLKLCPKSNDYLSELGITLDEEDKSSSEEDFVFNEIDDDELPVQISFETFDQVAAAPNCLMCEEIVKMAEKRMGKNPTKADIEKHLEESCDKLKLNLRSKCHKIVDKYGDKIATLLLREMDPKVICTELGMCLAESAQEELEIDEALKYDVIAMPNNRNERLTGIDDLMIYEPNIEAAEPPSCVLCEFVMTKLEMELKNKTTQDEIKHTIEHICDKMPKTVAKNCDKFVEEYANAVIALIGSVPPKEICQKMALCSAGLNQAVNDEVIECGVCHGATFAVRPYVTNHDENVPISTMNMVTPACMNLPGKYYEMCQQMISVYGPSIVNLIKRGEMDESEICSEIGKCFENENSRLAFIRISA